MKSDTEPREREAIEFLDSIQSGAPGVLIGGYAVAAYGPPRFSVDVDLVYSAEDLGPTARRLRSGGFSVAETMRTPKSRQAWVKLRIQRGPLTGDLYFGGLRARQGGVQIDAEWILKRPTLAKLRLLTGSTAGPVRIARPEALWVLKLVAGRIQDLTDLFSIRTQRVDYEEVKSKLREIEGGHLAVLAAETDATMRDPKTFHDALTLRELGSPSDARNIRSWAAFHATVRSVLAV